MNWYNTYLVDIKKQGSVENYIKNKIKFKKPLIGLIKKYALNKRIIETGSGTGIISTYFANEGFDVTALDIDDDMLKLANQISSQYNENRKPIFKKESILNLNYKSDEFDVAFSNGVLEHFNDDEIVNTLSQQMNISKIVIFGVPTKHFNQEEAMYGDERYLDYKYWRDLIKKSGGIILEEKSMHYTGIKNRILNFKKWFRPLPFRIFVVRKDQ